MAHPKSGSRNRLRVRRQRGGLQTVLATRTRNHLLRLSAQGIGRKAVQEFTGIDHRTLSRIRSGQTKRVRRKTAQLIRSVPLNVHCDLARIDAAPVWGQIAYLINEGYTRSEIARKLGAKRPKGYASLNIGREKVTARTAMKIQKLYNNAVGAY